MAASAADEPGYLLADTYDVAFGNKGEKDHNTIVLSGIDLVIPVELDMDGDPFQDDAVRLRAEHGHFDQVLAARDSDVEVDTENRYLFYRFRHVMPGAYRASVRVGDHWVPLLRGIVVTRDGAFAGGKKLGEDRPKDKAAEPEENAGEGELAATPATECGR
jgi:hypothetical protein